MLAHPLSSCSRCSQLSLPRRQLGRMAMRNEGKTLFGRCSACHARMAQNRVGPGLAGVVGRTAGTAQDFRFSGAMAASGITLDDQTLDDFLAAPRKLVPGTSMAVGLPNATVYEMEQRGEFPRRFALTPRCVVWDLSEVQEWLAARRSKPILRAPSPDVKQRRARPVKEQDRGSRSGIDGGMSVGTYFLPSTQASTMSARSCIMCRRCTPYSALL